MKSFVFCVTSLVLLICAGGCTSYHTYNSPYSRVAPALLECFHRNEWTKTGTIKSQVIEKNLEMQIDYWDWEFPNTKLNCQITAREVRGKTEVGVFIRDHDSWFAPFVHNVTYARAVLKLLNNRLRTGYWQRLPWRKPKSPMDQWRQYQKRPAQAKPRR